MLKELLEAASGRPFEWAEGVVKFSKRAGLKPQHYYQLLVGNKASLGHTTAARIAVAIEERLGELPEPQMWDDLERLRELCFLSLDNYHPQQLDRFGGIASMWYAAAILAKGAPTRSLEDARADQHARREAEREHREAVKARRAERKAACAKARADALKASKPPAPLPESRIARLRRMSGS